MSVNLSPVGGVAAQFLDNNGNPLSGGKIYTYEAGTTTPLASYTTSAGNVPHTNPIILDSAGRVPSGQIWLTDGNVDYKFLLETSTSVLVGTFDNIPPAVSGTSAEIVYLPAGAGAVATTVQAKLRESVSVKDFGATGDGTTNDTAAFAAARAITSRYSIPSGTYVLNASPDPFLDAFTAEGNVTLIIGGISYNCSSAFCGPLRFVQASATKTNILHAKSGNIIQYWQDGGPGTATGFFRGLAFTTNSHWVQIQPATNGGSVDRLYQRSTLNADPSGNRFNETFEEASDRLLYNFATTASGSPSFDAAFIVGAGLTPFLDFPALPAMFNQGWKLQTRALGALKLSYAPTTATTATFKDETSGNVLELTNRSFRRIAGTHHNTLLDVPDYKQSPNCWAGIFGDLVADAFPVNKTLFTLTGATRYTVIGTMTVACVASGGGAGQSRITRFTHDGTTLTLTDVVNTVANFTATIAMSGSNIQFQGSYAGGLGGGYAVSVSIDWCHVGR